MTSSLSKLGLGTAQFGLDQPPGPRGRPREAEAAHAAALMVFKQLVAEYPNRPEFSQELADGEAAQERQATSK